jgi:hypothetical protein
MQRCLIRLALAGLPLLDQNTSSSEPTGSSGLPWCWHPRLSCLLHGDPSPLAAKLAAGHGAGVSGNRGRDVGRVHQDPGRFAAEGRRWPWISSGDRALGTPRWSSPVWSRSPGVGGCDCPARPHPESVVTLSDMGGQGERAPSRLIWRLSHPAGKVASRAQNWVIGAAGNAHSSAEERKVVSRAGFCRGAATFGRTVHDGRPLPC